MGLSAARKRIIDLLLSRAGVSLHPHRFGESEYRLGKRELGHIHGDHLVDIPFSTKVSDEVVYPLDKPYPIMSFLIAVGLAFTLSNLATRRGRASC